MEFIEKYRLTKVPDVAYYIPDFIGEDEEHALLNHVYGAPKPKWKQLSHRRLQNWGGLPHPKGMLAEALPQWLKSCTDKIVDLNVFDGNVPNHVLINEYLAGQGIMPHTDGPLFYPTISTVNLGSHALLNFYKPLHLIECSENQLKEENVTSQTLASGSELPENGYAFSLLLLPRSCLILRGSLYHIYHHGIDECTSDVIDSDKILNLESCRAQLKHGDELKRSTRVSLTIRYVPKTLKINFGKTKS